MFKLLNIRGNWRTVVPFRIVNIFTCVLMRYWDVFLSEWFLRPCSVVAVGLACAIRVHLMAAVLVAARLALREIRREMGGTKQESGGKSRETEDGEQGRICTYIYLRPNAHHCPWGPKKSKHLKRWCIFGASFHWTVSEDIGTCSSEHYAQRLLICRPTFPFLLWDSLASILPRYQDSLLHGPVSRVCSLFIRHCQVYLKVVPANDLQDNPR